MWQVAELSASLKAKEDELSRANQLITTLQQQKITLEGKVDVVAEKDSRISYLERREQSTWNALLHKVGGHPSADAA